MNATTTETVRGKTARSPRELLIRELKRYKNTVKPDDPRSYELSNVANRALSPTPPKGRYLHLSDLLNEKEMALLAVHMAANGRRNLRTSALSSLLKALDGSSQVRDSIATGLSVLRPKTTEDIAHSDSICAVLDARSYLSAKSPQKPVVPTELSDAFCRSF